MDPVSLSTERLVLDQPALDDVDRIAEYCRDPLFERYLTTPWPYTRAHAVGFVSEFVPQGWASGGEATWALRHPELGFLGVVGITLDREERPSGMIGFWLGAPHRGQGFLPEAARAAIDWVFVTVLASRIRWEAVIPNRSSLEVARKLGFRYLGEGPGAVPSREGTAEPSWHAELLLTDSREPKEGWP